MIPTSQSNNPATLTVAQLAVQVAAAMQQALDTANANAITAYTNALASAEQTGVKVAAPLLTKISSTALQQLANILESNIGMSTTALNWGAALYQVQYVPVTAPAPPAPTLVFQPEGNGIFSAVSGDSSTYANGYKATVDGHEYQKIVIQTPFGGEAKWQQIS